MLSVDDDADANDDVDSLSGEDLPANDSVIVGHEPSPAASASNETFVTMASIRPDKQPSFSPLPSVASPADERQSLRDSIQRDIQQGISPNSSNVHNPHASVASPSPSAANAAADVPSALPSIADHTDTLSVTAVTPTHSHQHPAVPVNDGDDGDDGNDDDNGDAAKPADASGPTSLHPPGAAVSFGALYRYATPAEVLLLWVSILFALGSGAILPFFALLFGDLLDAVLSSDMMAEVIHISLMFVYLGSAMGVAGCIGVGGAGWVGERVSARVRVMYISTVIRMESGWHDGIDAREFGLASVDEMHAQTDAQMRAQAQAAALAADVAPAVTSSAADADATSTPAPAPAPVPVHHQPLTSSLRGDVSSRVGPELDKFQQGIGEKVALLCIGVSGFISGMAIAFYSGWELSLVVLAAVPALVIIATCMGLSVAALSVKEQERLAAASTLSAAYLSCVRHVHAHMLFVVALRQYVRELTSAAALGRTKDRCQGVGVGLFTLSLMGIYALGLWYGSELIADNKATGGNVLAIFNSLIIAILQFGNSAPHFVFLLTAKSVVYPVYYVIERGSLIDPFAPTGIRLQNRALLNRDYNRVYTITKASKKNPKLARKLRDRGTTVPGTAQEVASVASVNTHVSDELLQVVSTGRMFFHDLHFFYPSRPDVKVLNGLTFEIKPGSTVGLIGGSGCGKVRFFLSSCH
jgi:ABC-type multidrug transport system fused ATPase/permease subunit